MNFLGEKEIKPETEIKPPEIETVKKFKYEESGQFYLDSKDLPVNLNDYSWAGSLAKKTFEAYPKTHYAVAAGILIFATLTALALSFLLDNFNQVAIVFPISTFFGSLSSPILYSFLTKELRIIEPSDDFLSNNRYQLNLVTWWKKDFDILPASDIHYEKNQRIYWLWNRGERTYPLNFWSDDIKVTGEYHSAQIAGLEAYTQSVATYAFKKTLSMEDVVKYSLLAIVIGIEILAMFLLSSRVLRPVDFNTVGQTENVQSIN